MLIYESTMYMWKRRRQISKEYSPSQQDTIVKKKSSRHQDETFDKLLVFF
jgi:hypothetical protein